QPPRARVRTRHAGARGRPESLGPEERQVHGRGDRGQRLIRADVARRLLATDVLLARLQRVHEAAGTVRIHGLAGDTSGHLPHERLSAGEDPEVWPAVRHGGAERLAFAHADGAAEPAGRLEEGTGGPPRYPHA